ncbi:MAG: creatininase family protein [Acidimicrobiales bacterium]
MSFLPTQTSADEAQRSADHAHQRSQIALLPIGAFEQHGDHLPLTTDTLIASVIAKELANSYHLFLLPPISIACSHEHAAFAGTVSISASTLCSMIEDIQESLSTQGVDKLVLINAHGGNYVLGNIVQQANVGGPSMSLYPTSSDWGAARQSAGMETNGHEDMHGGELETSILLHAHPEVVRNSYVSADHIANDRPELLVKGMAKYTTTGIIGRPSLATAEKGKLALEALVYEFLDHMDGLH